MAAAASASVDTLMKRRRAAEAILNGQADGSRQPGPHNGGQSSARELWHCGPGEWKANRPRR